MRAPKGEQTGQTDERTPGTPGDPNRPIGVALVSEEYPPFFGGGIGTYAGQIARALTDAGVSVHVITLAADDTHPRHERDNGITVHRLTPWPAGSRAGSAAWFSTAAARKIAELAAANLIHIAEFAECGGAGSAHALLNRLNPTGPGARIPSVVHFHTPTEVLFELRSLSEKTLTPSLATLEQMERTSILLADGWCAPSRFIAEFSQQRYGLPSLPEVIPYALRNRPATTADVPDQPRVLFVGRLEPRKGLRVLLSAWRSVVEAHPDAELRLVGADTNCGPDNSWYGRWLVAQLPEHVRSRVTIVGPLPPDRLADEQARARLAVVPSLWENFPFTCIEAMSHARPMVVADQGGMAEMVEGSGAGEIVPSGDDTALAAAIIAMLNKPTETLTSMGLAGREKILRMCAPETVVSQRIAMYRRLIEAARGTTRSGGSTTQRDQIIRQRLDLWRRWRMVGERDFEQLDRPPMSARIRPWLDAETELECTQASVAGPDRTPEAV